MTRTNPGTEAKAENIMRKTIMTLVATLAVTASAHAQEAPGGLPSLLADQITGINVLSYNAEPRRVKEPVGEYWTMNNKDGNRIIGQTRCAGYQMEHGEVWRFCELTQAATGGQEYFWQDARGQLVIGPVEWN